MKYNNIIKQIALKEGVPENEIEKEMQLALNFARLNCSPRKLIKIIDKELKKTIYSKSYNL